MYYNKYKKNVYSHTGNMIYVRNDLINKLSIPVNMINSLDLFDRRRINGNI